MINSVGYGCASEGHYHIYQGKTATYVILEILKIPAEIKETAKQYVSASEISVPKVLIIANIPSITNWSNVQLKTIYYHYYQQQQH